MSDRNARGRRRGDNRDHVTLELRRIPLRHGNILPEDLRAFYEMSTRPTADPNCRRVAEPSTSYSSVGPTGVGDVRQMVWLQMVTIEAPVVEHNSDKFLRAIEAAGSDPAGVATSDASIDVGGVLTSFSLATYGNGWAP